MIFTNFIQIYLLALISLISGYGGTSINTPPHISFEREWILTEDEPIGSTVTRIIVSDADKDAISISIGNPSSKAFQGRHDAASFFVVDEDLRVKLARSLKGMAGETFLVGIIASDGHVPNRVDAKVTIRKPNEIIRLIPSGLPTSFNPGPPPPLKELHRTSLSADSGPPLLHLDPFTVWIVLSNASAGTFVAKVEAQDLSHTYLKFSLHPSTLLKIDDDSGEVIVANSLLNQVGEHKIEIKVSDQYSYITEEVTLRVTSPGENLVPSTRTSSSHSPSSTASTRHDDSEDLINEIENDFPEVIEPSSAEKGKVGWNVVLLVLVFGIIPVVMVAVFLLWRCRRRRKSRSARKESSVSFRAKGVDIIRSGSRRRESAISGISGLFSAVGLIKRAQSNKYEENVNNEPRIPHRDSKFSIKSSKSNTSIEVDDKWEFPRHKLRVLGILGEGCFGQVWKCETTNLIEDGPMFVAVKTIKESAGAEEHKDLLQELKVLKGLEQHPNVVSLLGCCTEKDPIFVILEYMIGGKLQSYLRSSRVGHTYGNLHGASDCLTPRDLTIFALQVAKGMVFLSRNGIIHRDLAARNVLMGEDKVCKVADFGFARDVANNHVYERKSDGRLPIRWMAPESLFDNIFTTKSDVWSFGILLWEIVTLGSTPYPGLSAADVMRSVKDGYRLEKPDHCRREIYNVMYYCWDSDQNNRLSFTELVHTLESMIMTEVDYIQLDNFPEHHYYNFNSVEASGELL